MTDPGALAARVQAAQRGLTQLVEASQREGAQAAQVRDGLGALAGRASSKDGGITVTVDSSGAMTGLELTGALTRFTPPQLAGEILACQRRAQADLAARAQERFGGNAFGERLAASLAERYPVPPEPQRAPQRAPQPEPEDDFGGSVFTRGGR